MKRLRNSLTASALMMLPFCSLLGCQSLWQDVPTTNGPASKVQLDAPWFASSGLADEQLEQLIRQRREHIATVQAERAQTKAGQQGVAVLPPVEKVRGVVDSAAAKQNPATDKMDGGVDE